MRQRFGITLAASHGECQAFPLSTRADALIGPALLASP